MGKTALIGGPQGLALVAVAVAGAVVAGVIALRQPEPEAAMPVPLAAPIAGDPAAATSAAGAAPPVAAPPAVAPIAEAPGVPQAAPPTDTQAGSLAAVAPETAPQAAPETVPEPAPDAAAATAVTLPGPSFDVVRVDAEGNATIAGRAAPGVTVRLMLDSAEIGQAVADASGSFALLTRLDPAAVPRVMALEATGPDGVAQRSLTEAIIAPFAGPQVAAAPTAVATVAPEATTGPATATGQAPTAAEAATTAQVTAPSAQAPVARQPLVPQASAPAIVMTGPGGVEVVQGAGQVSEGVVLDAITYDDAGEVRIAGRGTGNGFVRVYLDNQPVTEARIAGDGRWQSDLPQVAAGLYTLRVDQIDAAGRVLSRVETPFRREAPEQLAALARGGATTAAAAPDTATADSAPDTAAQPAPAPAPDTASASVAGHTAQPAPSGTGLTVAGAGADPVAASPSAALPAALPTPATEPRPVTPAPLVTAITVQPGSTLWAIARDRYGSGALYVRLFEANRDSIRDPDLIYPGQVFALPD